MIIVFFGQSESANLLWTIVQLVSKKMRRLRGRLSSESGSARSRFFSFCRVASVRCSVRFPLRRSSVSSWENSSFSPIQFRKGLSSGQALWQCMQP